MQTQPDRKSFWRQLFPLMLPIVLQNLLSAVVSTADVLMLSGVSQNALAASSLAGQVTFVLTLFYLGLSTGASVLGAQYWGKRETGTISIVQGLALRLSSFISLLFFLAALAIPGLLMRIFTNDPALIELGIGYLRFVSVSYLMMGFSQILLSMMKSIEETRLSAAISMNCLLCNIALNAVSIYLLFPGQEMKALCGVAAATSISRVIELILCFWAQRQGKAIRTDVHDFLHTPKLLTKDFAACTLPVQANYLIWGCATAAIAAILGHLGTAVVAANSIASTLRNLVIVACSGLGTAGSILIGKQLGQNDFDAARWTGDHVFSASLILGAVSGCVLMVLKFPCQAIARLDAEATALFNWMAVINAVYCIGKSFNSCLVGGVFCAGGDTRFGLICDTIAMWAVILPAGLLGAFVLHWPPLAVYTVLCMDEFVKLPFVAHRYKKYKWLRNLTRGNS